MKKLLLLVFLVVFLIIPFSLAYQESQPQAWKTNECKNFIQTSYQCSYIILDSITNPDKTITIVNQNMTKSGSTFNYTYCANNGTGQGSFNTVCPDYNVSAPVSFTVNNSGTSFDSSKATIYFLIFIFSLLVFSGLLWMGIGLPSKNKTDEMTGYVIALSNIKYLKIVFLGFAYLVALFISYFTWNISYNYLDMDFMTTIFRSISLVLTALVLPMFILLAWISIANIIKDNKLGDLLNRGIKVRE